MSDSINETNSNLPSQGLWANFMRGVSAHTGLSVQWLQFIGLLIGALACFLASEFFHRIPWDSAALLFRVGTILAGVGAIVVLLSSVGRRIVISLVILFHFGGILTAVTAVDPAPWVVMQIWTTVYRPYLYFMWLNNAYHFYSPEPGPANLMWFCIEYEPDEDGTKYFRWVLVPDLDEQGQPVDPDGSRVRFGTEYTRRLSLAEYSGTGTTPRLDIYELFQKRLIAGQSEGIYPPSPSEVPFEKQYREPSAVAKNWIQSYVRHVAHSYHHQRKPEKPVIGVKFYRVIHQILVPGQLQEGRDPNHPSTYSPFYYGEFDKDGNMKKDCEESYVDPNTSLYRSERRDPFLYWLIPTKYLVLHAQGPDFKKSDSNFRELREEQTDKGGEDKK
jgi:hypothetical protein